MPNNEKLIEETKEIIIEPVVEVALNEPPDWLPAKFWDAKKGEIRLQALAKSYKLLEKRLSGASSSNAPVIDKSVEKPVDKSVDLTEENIEKPVENLVDNSVNSSVDKSMDDVVNLDEIALANAELEEVFGGADKWQRLRPQLLDWGRRNLPEAAFASLSGSVEGIKALHGLMLSRPQEPRLAAGGDLPQALDETRLRRMMEDPRYWRERDPEFVGRVLRGFQQLYGN